MSQTTYNEYTEYNDDEDCLKKALLSFYTYDNTLRILICEIPDNAPLKVLKPYNVPLEYPMPTKGKYAKTINQIHGEVEYWLAYDYDVRIDLRDEELQREYDNDNDTFILQSFFNKYK